MGAKEVLERTGPRKLLALDGGGIRGIITLEILAKIEKILREKSGKPTLVLAEYFDYVAGTSTGAIIATCISLGMPIETIRQFYLDSGKQMFEPASLLNRLKFKYNDEPLARQIKAQVGESTTLDSDELKTLLVIVMRNASTDSPWPLSNHPRAKYNSPDRPDCNLNLPLWQLVRASTAAPTYFPPELVEVGPKIFVFVDGGVTTFNNPAFQLFLMATVEPYNCCWPTGSDKMLLVSVGTGAAPAANGALRPDQMNLLYNAGAIPSALMAAALHEQDFLCRVFGDCRVGGVLDREVGDMIGTRGPVTPKLFTYLRYNADLSRGGLDALGLSGIDPEDVQRMDSIDHVDELSQVGKQVAVGHVDPEHFAGFPCRVIA
jgi:hypothetical protein